jgi:hypothetical protein
MGSLKRPERGYGLWEMGHGTWRSENAIGEGSGCAFSLGVGKGIQTREQRPETGPRDKTERHRHTRRGETTAENKKVGWHKLKTEWPRHSCLLMERFQRGGGAHHTRGVSLAHIARGVRQVKQRATLTHLGNSQLSLLKSSSPSTETSSRRCVLSVARVTRVTRVPRPYDLPCFVLYLTTFTISSSRHKIPRNLSLHHQPTDVIAN